MDRGSARLRERRGGRRHAAELRIVTATGDGEATAVAARLGIDDVYGEVKPADKLTFVARLKKERHVVTMAGDGINVHLRSRSSLILTCAQARSISRRSSPRRSNSRRRCSTPKRSSIGRGCAPSHTRPVLPNRSVAGHRSIRCAASTAWTSFLSLVRCRTSCARRETCRRRANVFSSGIQTSGRNGSRTVVRAPPRQSFLSRREPRR